MTCAISRTVKAYFDDGSELGVLRAARPWCFTPHSLRVRQEIFRLLAERKLTLHDGDDPMEVWAKYKWSLVKTSKKAANDLAKAAQGRRTAQSSSPHYKVPTLVSKEGASRMPRDRNPHPARRRH